MKHSDERELPWTAEQMFDLVADIGAYPEFLPWCAAARIRDRHETETGTLIDADLVVAFKVFRERFGSRVLLDRETRTITTDYIDGPFKHLHSVWRFVDRADGGSGVAFSVDFEFRNFVLQKLIGLMFNEAMQRIVGAFEARARQLYG